jgi:hypothetical protein
MHSTPRSQPYEHRLRTIGARLDAGGYHSASIVEADEGLFVRASAPGSRTPEVLELQDFEPIHAAQLAPMRNGVPHRLFPDGYKGFLAALGMQLDRSRAAAVAIVEGTDFVTVGGIHPVEEAEDGVTYEALDLLLLADDIQALLAQAEALRELEQQAAAQPLTAPEQPADSLLDSAVNRVTALVDSALRMISFSQNPARTRG